MRLPISILPGTSESELHRRLESKTTQIRPFGIESLEDRRLLAMDAVLVGDLNPGAGSSSPSNIVEVGSLAYFSANGANGVELWRSDGTASGTGLVKDIRSGVNSSSPQSLTNVGGSLYFTANDGVNGVELWKSDGTSSGTVLVKDIAGAANSSSPQWLTNVGGTLYFTANDGVNGVELWKSDGSSSGTVLVKDVYGGLNGSSPQLLTNMGGTLFFGANDGVNGIELWKSDGTPSGTVLVKDVYSGANDSNPSNLTNVGGTLYFAANDGIHGHELWKSDGTESGTVLVRDIDSGADGSLYPFVGTFLSVVPFANVGGTLYFVANDWTHGLELWKSDGTASGTGLVKDIRSGANGSMPVSFLSTTPRLDMANVGGTLYFRANDGFGNQLWKSDGTESGTVEVKSIAFPGENASPSFLTNVGGTLYFRANDPWYGYELWKSDGTSSGTVIVKDVNGGANGSGPSRLANVGGTLYFSANDGVKGSELWAVQLTAAAGGPYALAEGNSLTLHADPVNFVMTGNGVDNAALQKNELELSANLDIPGVGQATLAPNTSITGTITADVNYTDGVLTGFRFRESPLAVADASSTVNIPGVGAVTMTFEQISGYITSSAPQLILSTTTNHGGVIGVNDASIVLNHGIFKIEAPLAFPSLILDLSINPATLSLSDFGANAALSVNSKNYIGTLNCRIPNTTNLSLFLGAILSPDDLAMIAPFIASGTFGLDLTGQAALSNAISAPSLTYHWDLNGDNVYTDATGQDVTLTWAQLQALGVNDSAGAYHVSVRVSDGVFTSTSIPVPIAITNVAPTATFTNGGAVSEGSSGVVSFSDPFDPSSVDQSAGFTYSYDFDDDGIFEIADGAASTVAVPASFLLDGPGSRSIRGRIIDKDGGYTDYSTTISVNNVAPTASAAGPPFANRGQSVSFVLSAVDPSPVDQSSVFTFNIDWDGDGSIDQMVVAPSGSNVFHSFAVAGSYTVGVVAIDKDGGASPLTSTAVRIDRGTLNAEGSQSAVNATTAGEQTAPAVANDLFGNYVVAWVDSAKDGSGAGSGVYASVLNNTGGVVVPEFRVNTTLASNQDQPAVAMNANGQFVVVWRSGQNVGNDVYAKVYNRFGQVVRDEFLVNSGFATDNQAQASVAVDAVGNFVVVWQSNNQDGSGLGVYGQRYNALGVAQGGMFQANVATSGNQDRPRVDMDDAGNFVVVWRSSGQDGSGLGVYSRRYNSAGVALDAAEVRVHTTTAGDQTDPSVALSATGAYVVSWTGADGSGAGIHAQRFSAAGVPLGSEFLVNQNTTDNQQLSVVSSDAFGDFVVAWESNLQDGSGLGVYYRKFSSDGAAQTNEALLHTTTAGDQKSASITLNGDGDMVAAWQGPDAAGQGVYAQRYNFVGSGNSLPTASAGGPYAIIEGQSVTLSAVANDPNNDVLWYRWDLDGNGSFGDVVGQSVTLTWQQFRDLNLVGLNVNSLPQVLNVAVRVNDGTGASVTSTTAALTVQPAPSLGAEQLVNATTAGSQEAPAIASDAAGNYVVVWEGPDGSAKGVFARRYNADGTPGGAEFQVNAGYNSADQFRPTVSMDSVGNFIILWQSYGQDGNGFGIFGRRYDSSGNLVGSEFQVNSTSFDNQVRPVVKLRDDGTFVAIWQSYGQDGDQHGIFGRRFDASNNPLTGEFAVNTFTTGFQEFPKIAMDATGAFVVTWTSGGNQDGDGQGIFARKFNPDGSAAGAAFQVNTVVFQNQFKSVVGMDSAGNFVIVWTDVAKDGNANGIVARRYNSSGVAIDAAEFVVNAYSTNLQQLPSVAMDASGDWVVAWESSGQDGSDFGVYTRTFSVSGPLETAEFRVSQTTANAQSAAAVTLAPTGKFIVAWQSVGQDGDQGGIYVRRFQHPNIGNDRSAIARTSSDGPTTGALYLLGYRVSESSGTATPSTDAVDQWMAELAIDPSLSTLLGFDDVRRTIAGSTDQPENSLVLDFGMNT